ncbi:hypothetical protein [Thioclava sp. GXIMD4216]|uniref:hypothetical protein n=1 Tax=unclassified Thioclava TaxID=2621713 RepID=UPI0030D077D8
MPNLFAYFMLFVWPLITWQLFKRYPATKAAIGAVIWGYLLLPERPNLNFPVIPNINKSIVPSLAVLIVYHYVKKNEIFMARRAARHEAALAPVAEKTGEGVASPIAKKRQAFLLKKPRTKVRLMLILATVFLLISPVITYLTNRAPIVDGLTYLPGIRPYDVAAYTRNLACLLLPFFVGLKLVTDRQGQIWLLRTIVFGGLLYTVAILIEIRMSPQLSTWIYGFFAHDFRQHYRNGGWRPIVFLAHGLRVGIFMSMAVLAAATLARASDNGKSRLRWLLVSLWLLVALYLSKNTGALLITVLLLPILLVGSRGMQAVMAGIIAALVLCYPIVRGTNLVPTESVAETIAPYAPERAASLEFRLRNEDELLAHANLKPLAGWGGWGRNLLFNPETGKPSTITDGIWIIIIGQYGWIGYLSLFGFICLPVILCAFSYRKLRLDTIDIGMMVVMAANMIDLIPNSSLVAPIWLLSGALWVRYDQARQTEMASHLSPRERRLYHKRDADFDIAPDVPAKPTRKKGRLNRPAVTS